MDPLIPNAEPQPQATPATPEPNATPSQTPPVTHWSDQYATNPVIKDSNIIKRYKTPEDALLALDNQHRTLSRKLTDIPDEKADNDTVRKFFSELRGKLPEQYRVPEKPDGYKVTATITDASGNQVPPALNEQSLVSVREACHKCGIDNQTFNGLVMAIYEAQQNAPQMYKSNIEKWLSEASKTNSSIPNYAQFADEANREFNTWPDDLKQSVADIPKDALARIAWHYAQMNKEDSIPQDANAGKASPMTLDEIEKRKMEISRDPRYKSQFEQGSGDLWDEYNELMKKQREIERNK